MSESSNSAGVDMGRNTPRVAGQVFAFTVAAAGLAFAILGPVAVVLGADEVKQQPSAHLVSLGQKFEGSAGCNNANCHDAAPPKPPPKPAGNEAITWAEKDKHAE